jgi:uncharacterized protein YyaL (SSP411 family)
LAYQVTGNPFYREVAEGIIDFVTDVLLDRERGGFYGSQDADIDHDDDGDYFTWTKGEVREALSRDEARVISLHYNVYSHGEMKHNPARNVLFIDMRTEEVAERLGMSSERVKELIQSGKKNLFEARKKRSTPYVDKVLYASWNGLMISAFLLAHKIMGNDTFRDSALKTIDFLVENCFQKGAGFYHTYLDGKGKVAGLLDDQLKMGMAFLDAYEVTGQDFYLEMAINLAKIAAEKFYDQRRGGFFDVEGQSSSVATLRSRFKPIQDDPIQSPNSSAAMLFDKLYYITSDYDYRRYAEGTLKYFSRIADKYGLYAASYFIALHHHVKHPVQVVVVGDAVDFKTQELLRTAWSIYRPHKLVIQVDPTRNNFANLSENIQEMAKLRSPCACVCAGNSCAEPTNDVQTLRQTIKRFRTV